MDGVLEAGQMIAGRYLLASPIGEGAMGAVWRAEDQTLKRHVAIKFLFVKAARDPQAMVDQFLREARIAASVQHRNVIQTVDFGTFDQFQPFMVMELLNGESLGDRLAREPPLSREQTIHIVSLTLRGLAAVHDAGIVHRDLKPQNIFLQRDSDAVYPKILDFGISRSVASLGERPSAIATQEGMIVGTPDYMSPEQARGEGNIDKRSDIYSMGVILYEGLTGQLPFDAKTVGELIVQIVTQEPPPMRAVAPEVPQSLSDMVAQCMSKSRDHRFSDARAMRRALLAAAESALPPGRRPAVSVSPPETAAPEVGLFAAAPAIARRAPAPFSAAQSPPDSAHGVTWGDFEGMNAPQILDSKPPAHAGAASPSGPNPQRIVARLADQIPSLLPPAELVPPPRPGDRASADRAAVDRAAAPAARGKPHKPRKAPAPGTPSLGEDAMDPLYAGVDQAALDIDYERVRGAARTSQAQPQAQTPAPQRTRRRAGSTPGRQRTRYRPRIWAYVLPALALVLAYYALTKPSLGEDGPSAHALAPGLAADHAAQPVEPAGAAAGEGIASPAEPGVRPIRGVGKGRRANPGRAPAHLRDVVF
jgi:serine/threonine-protein kinase